MYEMAILTLWLEPFYFRNSGLIEYNLAFLYTVDYLFKNIYQEQHFGFTSTHVDAYYFFQATSQQK